MEYNKQSPEVLELRQKLDKSNASRDFKAYLDYAMELYTLAQDNGSKSLKDFASCVLGEACCQNRDLTQGFYLICSGIKGLAVTDEYELLCKSYNELGIAYQYQANYISSQESFLNAIYVARNHRLYKFEVNACHNFASLCEEMNDWDNAIQYRYRVIELLNLIEDENFVKRVRGPEYSALLQIYIKQNNAKQAAIAYELMEAALAESPEYNSLFDIILGKLAYCHFFEYFDKEKEFLAQALELYYSLDDYTNYMDEIGRLAEYLLDAHDFEELIRCYHRFEIIIVDDNFIAHRIRACALKVAMYEITGEEEKRNAAAYEFMQLQLKVREETKKSFATTLRLEAELLQQRASNLFLSAAADTDALTGLPNRKKLNEVIDELFSMANDSGVTLAVEMLDLDFFKEVNDTMGHDKGDELLVAFANEIKDFASDQIFVARYGGDEFIIYYYNMKDNDIMNYVRKIRDIVEDIRIKLQIPALSVSQGIVNHVPAPLNRAWDYMMVADESLYFVKNNGKNNARLVHSLSELKETEWEKPF